MGHRPVYDPDHEPFRHVVKLRLTAGQLTELDRLSRVHEVSRSYLLRQAFAIGFQLRKSRRGPFLEPGPALGYRVYAHGACSRRAGPCVLRPLRCRSTPWAVCRTPVALLVDALGRVSYARSAAGRRAGSCGVRPLRCWSTRWATCDTPTERRALRRRTRSGPIGSRTESVGGVPVRIGLLAQRGDCRAGLSDRAPGACLSGVGFGSCLYLYLRRLCVTLEQPEPALAGDAANGALGVDLNKGHLALVDVSPDGRVVGAERVPLPKDRDVLFGVARRVVRAALARGVPIVLESLDFRKKKSWLKSYGRRFAGILSTFRTRQVSTVMEREARREGVEVRFVDPAWSTKLGRLKYRVRCRVGTHHAAALVVGRRGLGFGERLRAKFRGEGCSAPVRTVECTGTSGFSKAFVQRLRRAWLEGGRRRRGGGVRARGAPVTRSRTV